MSDSVVVVVGQGEIGKPLQKILARTYQCIGVDIAPVEVAASCSTVISVVAGAVNLKSLTSPG